MNEKIFYGKDLLKNIKEASDKHAEYTEALKNVKNSFRKNFDKNTLTQIEDCYSKLAYDEQVCQMRDFVNKVNNGNFDENDIEIFKMLIEPYLEEIYERIE